MSIWNHLPVYAVVAGPMRAREAVEADRHRVSEATWQRLEQMREADAVHREAAGVPISRCPQ